MLNPGFAAAVDARWPGMAAALEGEPVLSLRYNRAKCADVAVPAGAEPVPWCGCGFYLDHRPQFTLDPALHQGLYYVQEASSMAIGMVAEYLSRQLGDLGRPLMYLDACAAPGGKTTAAIDALPPGAIVFANEYDYHRANILAENVAKWGPARTVLTRGDTARYSRLRSVFDIIAVDTPCSGEGMMRKDPVAASQWSPALVAECAVRQREILSNLWPALRPGGMLIYSTCTFNDSENDDIIAWLESEYGAERLPLPLAGIPGICDSGCVYRFLPSRLRGEGLCMAAVRKPETDGGTATGVSRKNKKQRALKADKAPAIPPAIKAALPAGFVHSLHGSELWAMPADMNAIVAPLLPMLDVLSAGIVCGELKGPDVVPAQQLALARDLQPGAFPQVAVDRATALTYLRREAIDLPDGTPTGPVLLNYGGHPLGFVKNIGRRSNSLYPPQWRIKSALRAES